MASVEIRFEGVMLFALRNGGLEILIPNAENPDGKHHPDGGEGRRHFAWLTSPEPGAGRAFTVRESLTGADISIGNQKQGPPKVKDFEKLFRIDRIVNRLQTQQLRTPRSDPTSLVERDSIAARVTLWGGSIAPDEGDGCTWAMDDGSGDVQTIRDAPECVVWDSGQEKVTVAMKLPRNCSRVLELAAGSTIVISNLDHRTPEEFEGKTTTPKPIEPEDVDFKWVYHLFSKNPQDWGAVLQPAGKRGMPIPVLIESSTIKSADPSKCKQGLINLP